MFHREAYKANARYGLAQDAFKGEVVIYSKGMAANVGYRMAETATDYPPPETNFSPAMSNEQIVEYLRQYEHNRSYTLERAKGEVMANYEELFPLPEFKAKPPAITQYLYEEGTNDLLKCVTATQRRAFETDKSFPLFQLFVDQQFYGLMALEQLTGMDLGISSCRMYDPKRHKVANCRTAHGIELLRSEGLLLHLR
jgi:hypothetical protein